MTYIYTYNKSVDSSYFALESSSVQFRSNEDLEGEEG